MIFYAKDNVRTFREKPAGGAGEIRGTHPFQAEGRPQESRFKMVGEMTLSPGGSIGFHIHAEDEEIYIITAGRGFYTDADRREYPVAAGDMTLTRRGEGHGLKNDGAEPLVFTAVIAE